MKWVVAFTLLWCNFPLANAKICDTETPMERLVIDEEQLLISVLRLNGRPVWDGFDVYQVDKQLLVPASLFSNALDLNWDVSVSAGTIMSKGDDDLCAFTLALDLTSPVGSSRKQGVHFWAIDDFDIYIDITMLSELLPIEAIFDFSLLLLNLTGTQLASLSASNGAPLPTFTAATKYYDDPTIVDKYHFYTTPLINYRILSNRQDSNEQKTSLNLNAGFDLFKHAANLRISRTEDTSTHYLRFTKTLNDKTGIDAIDNNGVTYELGDIQLQKDELVMGSGQALGVLFHNGNAYRRRNFSNTTIEEFVLPGWRVQLFRNGQFIEEKFGNEQNTVIFDDVETYFGANLFELKLYGPDGEQETRVQTVNVGENQIAKGEVDFLLSVSDNQYRLLDGEVRESDAVKAAVAKIGVGLTDKTTISGGIHQLWIDDVKSNYFSTALDTQFIGAALKFEISKQDTGGYGTFVGWNGRLSHALQFNFTNRYLNDFTSELYPETQELKNVSSLRLNGRTELFNRINWNASATLKTDIQGENYKTIDANISDNLLGGTFASGLNYNDAREDKLSARLYFARDLNGWGVSSSWNFSPDNGLNTENFYLSVRWPQHLSQYRETRLQYKNTTDDSLALRHQHNWRTQFANIGLAASLASGGDWSVNLSMSGNLSVASKMSQWNFTRSATNNLGRIDAFVYFDENRNYTYDPEETKIEGVSFGGNHLWKEHTTELNGVVRLNSNNRIQNIYIDEGSLPDPYFMPALSSANVITHAGGTNRVEFPVHTVNEIEGTVFRQANEESRGISKLKLSLQDEQQQTIAITTTESDGYFYFSKIPPGNYTIEIDDTYLKKNELHVIADTLSLNAPTEGDAIYIGDIRLARANQPSLLAENTIPDESDTTSKAPGYEIQVGAFQYASSMYELLKRLPLSPSSLNVYRNIKTGLQHVSLGRFDSINDASATVEVLKNHSTYSDAFIRPSRKYATSEWNKPWVFQNIKARLDNALSYLLQNPAVKYCQLAAYRALSSIDPRIFKQNPDLMLLPKEETVGKFYKLVVPNPEGTSCGKMDVSAPFRNAAFSISRNTLLKTYTNQFIANVNG